MFETDKNPPVRSVRWSYIFVGIFWHHIWIPELKNKTKFKPKLNNIFIRNKIFTKVTSLYVYVVLVNTAECTKLMRLNLLEHPVSRNVSYIYYIVGLGLARSQCLVCCVLVFSSHHPWLIWDRQRDQYFLSFLLYNIYWFDICIE